MKDTYITTGEFGKLSGLSVKALRLYDVSGLLAPASVDAVTGYRRYSPDQLERARRIGLLRQVDVPLAVIADVLSGTDAEALHKIDMWWAGQEAAMRSRRGSLDYLRAILVHADQERTTYPVDVVRLPEVKLATISRVVDQSTLVATTCALEDELRRHLRASGAAPAVEHYVVFHGPVGPDAEATIEVCVPFEGTVDPAGPIVIRVEPAQAMARCTVSRGECFYPQIMDAYADLDAYVLDHGMQTTGLVREMYFVPWDAITDTDPFVHVAIPVLA